MAVPRPARRALRSGQAAPARLGERLVAVPAWAWLCALVVVSAAVRLALSRQLPAPWLFLDELTYRDLAHSFAESGRLEVRGIATYGYSVVYPVLIAPAYAIFENQAHAYAAAKAINAVVISLVAVPTYLLARRLVRPGLALVAAALALAIPSMALSSLVMTESAFYPLVALFAYVSVLALERPTGRRQLLLVAVFALAFLTRRQAAVLVPALVTAILLFSSVHALGALSGSRLRQLGEQLWRYRVTWLLLAAGAVASVSLQVARGLDASTVLGSYASVTEADYSPSAAAIWFVRHLADLDVLVGIVPFAALLVLGTRLARRGHAGADAAFTAVALSFVFWVVLAVAVFASRFEPRIEERLLFYLAPLLFVAFVVWIDDRRPDLRGVVVVSALVSAGLPALVVFGGMLEWANVNGAFGLWPLLDLVEDGGTVARAAVFALTGAAVAGVAFVLLPRRLRLVLAPLLALYFALASWQVQSRLELLSSTSLRGGIGGVREWVDDAAPRDADVVALWSTENLGANWLTEFFNGDVDRVLSFQGAAPDPFTTSVGIDEETGIVLGPVETTFAVASPAYRLSGEILAEDPVTHARVYRADSPLRLVERTAGQYGDGFSGPVLDYVRYGCDGGRLGVSLTHGGLIAAPQTVVASVAGRAVARTNVRPGSAARLVVPLRAAQGRCAVRFDVTPSFVPAEVLANGDARRLGIRFDGFEYERG